MEDRRTHDQRYRSTSHLELTIVQNATKATSQSSSHCYAKVIMEDLAMNEASCVRTTVDHALSLDIIMLLFHDQKRVPRLHNTAKAETPNK
jgi:hypothetical protein